MRDEITGWWGRWCYHVITVSHYRQQCWKKPRWREETLRGKAGAPVTGLTNCNQDPPVSLLSVPLIKLLSDLAGNIQYGYHLVVTITSSPVQCMPCVSSQSPRLAEFLQSFIAGHDAEEAKTQSEETKHGASHAARSHHRRGGGGRGLQQSSPPGYPCPALQCSSHPADSPRGPLWLSHPRHAGLSLWAEVEQLFWLTKLFLREKNLLFRLGGEGDLNLNF